MMDFEELFRDFWWLLFPIFGMSMGLWGMNSSERRSRDVMDVIKSYVDQGKEPPPELLRLVSQNLDDGSNWSARSQGQPNQSNAWSFFMFAGLAAGFAVAYAFAARTEDWAWVFLAVSVTMAVMALGALVLLIVRRK